MNPEEFENELKAALLREAAPADFAQRTMARLPQRRRYLPWALAAGLAIATAVPAVQYERHREQVVKAEEAKREMIAALRITQAKLRHTREVIQRRVNRI